MSLPSSKERRSHADDLRGAGRLAVTATRGVTDLVEAMHKSIGAGPGGLFAPLHAFSAPVYATIRGVAAVVGAGLDAALARLAPLLGESAPGAERDAVVAALNGVLGDYLAETGNPLALPMELRHDGAPLALGGGPPAVPDALSRVLILVHGSSMSDGGWRHAGTDLGRVVGRELRATPLHLRYNSGLHVSTNGRAFADLLEQLVAAWPVPLASLDLVCHSMGGLVARSACHVAEAAGHAWRGRLRHLVFLGTPHHGAPLERAGNWIERILPIHPHSAPLARLARIRSAGVTDLRHGNVLDSDWAGRDRFGRSADTRTPVPLPTGVACYAVAGTLSPRLDGLLLPDGLVTVDSALGRHERPELTLAFPEDHQLIAVGANHLDLMRRAEIHERVRRWLSG